MGTAIVSVFMMALLLLGTGLMAGGALRSYTTMTDGWQQAQKVSGDIARTSVSITNASVSGADLTAKTTNGGQTALLQFSNWDVIVQYYDGSGIYHQTQLSYVASSPAANQWSPDGIYQDQACTVPAKFQPGMLVAGETLKIHAVLSPAPAAGGNEIVVVTENGIHALGTF